MDPFDFLRATQRSFLEEALACDLRFLVVGGYAIRVHGSDRSVADLDVWVERSAANLRKLVRVLEAAGSEKPERIVEHLQQLRTKVVWFDVDIFVSMNELAFDVALAASVEHRVKELGGSLRVLSKPHLIEAKCLARDDEERPAEGRERDAKDLAFLEGNVG